MKQLVHLGDFINGSWSHRYYVVDRSENPIEKPIQLTTKEFACSLLLSDVADFSLYSKNLAEFLNDKEIQIFYLSVDLPVFFDSRLSITENDFTLRE